MIDMSALVESNLSNESYRQKHADKIIIADD
jgi:hypothetical protein